MLATIGAVKHVWKQFQTGLPSPPLQILFFFHERKASELLRLLWNLFLTLNSVVRRFLLSLPLNLITVDSHQVKPRIRSQRKQTHKTPLVALLCTCPSAVRAQPRAKRRRTVLNFSSLFFVAKPLQTCALLLQKFPVDRTTVIATSPQEGNWC